MTKTHTTLSIEEGVLKESKSKFLNLSSELEKALKEKLGKTQVEISKGLECEFCGKEGRQETAEDSKTITNTKDPLENPNLLTWIYPDEKWICNACLRTKAKCVAIGMK